MTSAYVTKTVLVPILVSLLLVAASNAMMNGSFYISNVGRIEIVPFGKNSPGDDYWYFPVSEVVGKKVGTIYNNTRIGSYNTIFARFSNWAGWDTSYLKTKAGVIDNTGNILDMSINEISLQPAAQFEHVWHAFRLSKDLTLQLGSYYLCLWISGYGALAYSCSLSQNASFDMDEDYFNPTGNLDNLSINRQFDIFATHAEIDLDPKAIIRTVTSSPIEIGNSITFDGSTSLPGFYGTNESGIVNYDWDFGDGTTDTGARVQKTYPSINGYTVRLQVTDSNGLQDAETATIWVKPVGGYDSFAAGFEEPGDFAVGVEHTGNYKYWDRERYFMDTYPGVYRFWPDQNVVHSGTQSAILELVNPTSDGTRRLQFLHDWNPLTTEHIWQEEWFYFPSDMQWKDPETGEALWRTIHAMVTERMWNPDLRSPYQEFSWRISVVWNVYTDRLIFDITGLAGVDNNDDGLDDFQQPQTIYLEVPGVATSVPIGTWFKITTHTYRNVRDWATNPAGGYIEIWIADESGHQIYQKIDNIHTIGIDPQRIAALTPWNQNSYEAYVTSGFAHYCGGLKNSYGVPSRIYVDDFIVNATHI